MIIRIDEHTAIDTEKELNSAERHILQKLLCYKVYVKSVSEFKRKTEKALETGWNESGPVQASASLKQLIRYLETETGNRLGQDQNGRK